MEFIDNGIEFNPLLEEGYAPPKDIGEAKIGGLGILLTKEMLMNLIVRIKMEKSLKNN